MPSLKTIRKRIVSVKSTQKITRAMKMVAGARLARAQSRIVAMRPYAVKTQELLRAVVAKPESADTEDGLYAGGGQSSADHPLLADRPEKNVAFLVLTSDRGLCGAFNTNINKAAERAYRERTGRGQSVTIYTIGRKGRDYFKRRQMPSPTISRACGNASISKRPDSSPGPSCRRSCAPKWTPSTWSTTSSRAR